MDVDTSNICPNCKRAVENNFELHVVHCSKRYVRCETCEEPILKEELEDHMKGHEKVRCEACDKMVESAAMQRHEEFECAPKQVVECEFCHMNINLMELEAHSDYCGSRTDHCIICGERVMLKNLDLHMRVHQRGEGPPDVAVLREVPSSANLSDEDIRDQPVPRVSEPPSERQSDNEGDVPGMRDLREERPAQQPGQDDVPCEYCGRLFPFGHEFLEHELACRENAAGGSNDRGGITSWMDVNPFDLLGDLGGRSDGRREGEGRPDVSPAGPVVVDITDDDITVDITDSDRAPTGVSGISTDDAGDGSRTGASASVRVTYRCEKCDAEIPESDEIEHLLSCRGRRERRAGSAEKTGPAADGPSEGISDDELTVDCDICHASVALGRYAQHMRLCEERRATGRSRPKEKVPDWNVRGFGPGAEAAGGSGSGAEAEAGAASALGSKVAGKSGTEDGAAGGSRADAEDDYGVDCDLCGAVIPFKDYAVHQSEEHGPQLQAAMRTASLRTNGIGSSAFSGFQPSESRGFGGSASASRNVFKPSEAVIGLSSDEEDDMDIQEVRSPDRSSNRARDRLNQLRDSPSVPDRVETISVFAVENSRDEATRMCSARLLAKLMQLLPSLIIRDELRDKLQAGAPHDKVLKEFCAARGWPEPGFKYEFKDGKFDVTGTLFYNVNGLYGINDQANANAAAAEASTSGATSSPRNSSNTTDDGNVANRFMNNVNDMVGRVIGRGRESGGSRSGSDSGQGQRVGKGWSSKKDQQGPSGWRD